MAHVTTGDLGLETTTSTGTGALTLAGAVAGHQTIAQLPTANGDTIECVIRAVDGNGVPTGDWERSICTYSTTGPTITRTTVIQSSNSDAAVSFAAGTKWVYRVATQEHEYLYLSAVDCDSSGRISGGAITVNADPSKLDIALGVGQGNDGTGAAGTMKRVTWGNFTAQNNIGAGYNHVAIVVATGALSISATKQSLLTHVYLGKGFFNSQAGVFTTIWNIPEIVGNFPAVVNDFVREAFRSIVSGGMTVTPGAGALTLNLAAGTAHFGLTPITIPGGSPASFLRLYGNTDYIVSIDSGGGVPATTLNVTQWNDATQLSASALVTMTNGYWKKDVLLVNPDTNTYYSIGRAEYATEAEARAAPIPGFSTFFPDFNIFCCELIIQKGDTAITADRIVDIRPYLPRVFFDRPAIYYDQLLDLPDHDDLPNISGGAVGERNHISDADLAGSGTGVYARVDSPVFVNPNLGTPSAAVGTNFSGIPQSAVTSLTSDLAAKQPLDADLTALAAAGNSTVLGATTASFLTADETKLDGIAAGATVGATWGSNITSQPAIVGQAEAEAGAATTERMWTAERVNQAIQALAPGGGSGLTYLQVRSVASYGG